MIFNYLKFKKIIILFLMFYILKNIICNNIIENIFNSYIRTRNSYITTNICYLQRPEIIERYDIPLQQDRVITEEQSFSFKKKIILLVVTIIAITTIRYIMNDLYIFDKYNKFVQEQRKKGLGLYRRTRLWNRLYGKDFMVKIK